MKKPVSILIILSILFVYMNNSAFADEFTIHSGVRFGMAHEEVTRLEEAAGFNVGEYEKSLFIDDMNVEVKGTIAGVSNGKIYYFFGYDDVLHEAFYDLYDANNYETVLSTMKEKYGEPGLNEGWTLSYQYHSAMLTSFVVLMSNFFTVNSTYWTTWLVKQENGKNLSIDLVNMDLTDKGKRLHRILISYNMFTDEEVSAIIEKMTNDSNNYQESMNNDL